MLPLRTERLTIRRLVETDVAFILVLLNDPDFIRFIGDKGVRTEQDALHYLNDGPLASYQRFGYGLYAVDLTSEKTPIGICGLINRDTLEDVDLGFAFLPSARAKGYASEASIAVLEHAKRDFGLNRVVAITQKDNGASMNVLEKLGMRYEGPCRLEEDAEPLRLYGMNLS